MEAYKTLADYMIADASAALSSEVIVDVRNLGLMRLRHAEIAGFDIYVRLFSLNRGPWLSPLHHRLRGLSLVDCGLALAARETRP